MNEIPCDECMCFPICLSQIEVRLNSKEEISTSTEIHKWTVSASYLMFGRCELFKEAVNNRLDSFLVPFARLFYNFKEKTKNGKIIQRV